MTENSNETSQSTPPPNGSTLIEFPGVHRNRPAWRKELSERFREIQQKRARESAVEAEGFTGVGADAGRPAEYDEVSTAASNVAPEATKQLGLVPAQPSDAPEMNPIVQAALRRIERARKPSAPPLSRGGSNRMPHAAAAAAARVVEEEPERAVETLPVSPKRPETRNDANVSQPRVAESEVAETPARSEMAEAVEAARASSLLIVAPKQTAARPARDEAAPGSEPAMKATPESEPAARAESQAKADAPAAAAKTVPGGEALAEAGASKPQPRRVAGVIDDNWLERRGVETLPKVETVELTYDDRAPLYKRFAASLLDLLVVAFLSAPFAAVIELSIGNWGDSRVWGSMAGIAAVMLFLYQTCSLALASRTLGMKIFSMQAADADTAHAPTTGQCARRALVYMLSLCTFGIGILYALFDAEGRAAHDLLSRTVVVKQ